ncbi:MAG: phage tail tape measure protein [Clostridia bacterium]
MMDAGGAMAYLDLDVTGFKRGISLANQLTSDLSSHALSASSKVKALGGAMSAAGKLGSGLTAVLLSAGTAAGTMSVHLDTAARKVATIADAQVMSLGQIKNETRALGAELGVMPNQLNEALYNTISATNDTASAMGTVEIATKAAVGGFTDATTAVDGLTTVTNAYGMQGAASVKKVSDQMLVAQNYGKTTFGEIASGIGNVIPLAAQLRIGTDELFGAIAALTRQGIGTSESITGLKAAFGGIIKPTAEAQKQAKALGLSFNASALESKGLAGFLQDVAQKTGGSTEKMSMLFGSVEALNAVLALTGTDGAKYFAGALEAMAASAGATDKAFEMMSGGAEGTLSRINVQASNIATTFGDIMLPAIGDVMNTVEGMLAGFQKLPQATQSSIVTIAAWTAAAGPMLLIGGKLVSTIGALIGVMSGPAGWVALGVAGIAALTMGLDALANNASTVGNTVNAAFDRMDKERVGEIAGKIQAAVSIEVTGGETGLQAQIDTQYQGIIDKLKTGGVVTPGDAAAVNTNVNSLIDTAMAGVDIAANSKITRLQAQLDSGVIDAKTYKDQCDQIIADAEATKAGLEAVRTQSKTAVDGLVGDASTTAVDAETALNKISEAAGMAVESINGMGDLLTIGSLYDVIRDKLTDGKADGQEQTDSLSSRIETWVAGEKTKIEEAINGQIVALNVNDADYTQKVESIKTQGAQMMDALKAVQADSAAWLVENSGRATEAVQANMDELDAIEQRAMEVSAKIAEATQTQKSLQEKNVQRVKEGSVRDEGTLTQTVGTVYSGHKSQKKDIETRRQQAMDELNDSSLTGGEYAAQAQAIADQYAAESQNLMAAYQQNLGELLAGIAEAFPEYSQQITDAYDKLDIAKLAEGLIAQLNSGEVSMPEADLANLAEGLGITPDALSQAISQGLTMDDPSALINSLGGLKDQLAGEATQVLQGGEGADFGPMGELLAGMIQAGMFDGIDGLDMTDGEAKLAAMMGELGEDLPTVDVPVAPTVTVEPEVDSSKVPGAVEEAVGGATPEPVDMPTDMTVEPGYVDASGVGTAIEDAVQESGGTVDVDANVNINASGGDAGAKDGSAYAKSLEGTAGKAQSAGSKVSASAAKGMGTNASAARRAGLNVATGFIASINAKASAARVAGYKLGAASIAGINAGAENASPSKAARRAALNTVAGYVNTLRLKIPEVMEASRAVGVAGISGFQTAPSGIDPGLIPERYNAGQPRDSQPAADADAGDRMHVTLNVNNPVVSSNRDIGKLSREINRYADQINRGYGGRHRSG